MQSRQRHKGKEGQVSRGERGEGRKSSREGEKRKGEEK